jgi:hypothetical protein
MVPKMTHDHESCSWRQPMVGEMSDLRPPVALMLLGLL